jgi:hypothetical protein
MRVHAVLSLWLLLGVAHAAPSPLAMHALPAEGARLSPAGGGAQLTVNARLVLGEKTLALDEDSHVSVRRYREIVEGNRAYYVLEYRQTSAKEVERTKVSIYNVPGKTDPWLRSAIHVAAVDLGTQSVLWRQDLSNMQCEGSWELLDAPGVLYARTLTTVYALAKGSGRYKWILDGDPLQSSLNDRYFLDWKIVGDAFVFHVTNRVDYDSNPKATKTLEIDMATGERVFRSVAAPRLEPEPVYVYHRNTVEYRGDRPSPELPKDFDGLKLERTLLLWSNKTREGIVVNPQRAILPQIVALARSRSVEGKPIVWKYVVDLVAVGKTASDRRKEQVLAGHKDEFAGGNEIFLEALGDLELSGEKIAAAALAKDLGAATLPSPPPQRSALEAAPIFIFRDRMLDHSAIADRDIPLNVKLKWGPYIVHERRYDHSYWKMED